MVLKIAIGEYMAGLVGVVVPATLAWYRQRLRPLASLGDVELSEVTASMLRGVWGELAGRDRRWVNGPRRPAAAGGLAPDTLAGFYRAWRTVFGWFVNQGWIAANPMAKLKRPPTPDRSPREISDSDLARMLAAAATWRDYAVLCFLASTGCRLGGLAGCRVGDVDLQSGRVMVREKGRGGGKDRLVYLNHQALAALKEYLYVERRWGGSDSLFGLRADGIRALLRRLAARAGVTARYNPHAFRHRFARNLLGNGCDLASVQQLMGHTDPAITVKYYGRWADAELRQTHTRCLTLPR